MPVYPIHVPRDPYYGSNPAHLRKQERFNGIAKVLESYLNNQEEENDKEPLMFDYWEIANATGHSEEDVRNVLFGVDAGHNGITIYKKKAS